jgi:hypothetical protein
MPYNGLISPNMLPVLCCLICCVWRILIHYTRNYICRNTTNCHKKPIWKQYALHISLWNTCRPCHSCCPCVTCTWRSCYLYVPLFAKCWYVRRRLRSSAMIRLMDRSVRRNFSSCLPVDTALLPKTLGCWSTCNDNLTFRMLCVCYSIRTSWNEMATSSTSCYRGGNATKTEQSWASKRWPGVSSTWLR